MALEKPSEREEEYFARVEFERKQKEAQEREAKLKEEERRQRKTLHFMCCPKCGMELIEIEYKGVKIDKCSDCAGVWLDCGEMERILDQEENFLAGMLGIFRRNAD